MSAVRSTGNLQLEARARQSRGTSDTAIYRMVAAALSERGAAGTLLDVGCGAGNLLPFVSQLCAEYVGVDAVRYEEFPAAAHFHQADLDGGRVPLPDGCADAVVAVETIEHLENPRSFLRELMRLAKPGGWVVVTTPNQLSLLSLVTLIFKRRFNAFQDAHYPAHITALLEVDLRRMAAECGLADVALGYSHEGRVALTPWHYPSRLARLFPRAMSDNVLLIGRKQRG
jgi:2-polyprenyl-3-methyl-5-hydroxy-6-metoxy-1,4-benzoquinol methylase